jgi:hypothetical protein
MMALFNGVALGCHSGEKGAQRGWCRGREVVLLTEVEIKAGPFVIIGAEGLRDPRLVQSAVKTGGQM